MTKLKTKRFSCVLSEDLHARLTQKSEELSFKKGKTISMNDIVIDALNEYLKEE